MEFLFADLFFSIIGWTFFLFKYRNARKMKAAKDADYEGSYINVGRTLTLNTFIIIFLLLIFSLLIAGIIGIFRFGFS